LKKTNERIVITSNLDYEEINNIIETGSESNIGNNHKLFNIYSSTEDENDNFIKSNNDTINKTIRSLTKCKDMDATNQPQWGTPLMAILYL
jgi:hypothetical protein